MKFFIRGMIYLLVAASSFYSETAMSAEIYKADFTASTENILSDSKTKVQTMLSSERFQSGGNSNWSKAVNGILVLKVGTGKFQDAIITTRKSVTGFSAVKKGIRYKIELGGRDFGSKRRGNGTARIYILGKDASGKLPSSWWAADNAFQIKFNTGWIGLLVKNAANPRSDKGTVLWSANYKGKITSFELLLTRNSYALAVNGIKAQWNMKGAVCGNLQLKAPDVFSENRFGFELKQNVKPVKPFSLDIISLVVDTVDEAVSHD